MKIRHAALIRLFSIAIICTAVLQLATVTRLCFTAERVQQNLLFPSIDALESNAVQRHQEIYVPIERDYDGSAPKEVPGSGKCHFLPCISLRQIPPILANSSTYFIKSRTFLYERAWLPGNPMFDLFTCTIHP